MPKHILIADNHPSVCQEIESKLKSVYPSARITMAYDGLQVLNILETEIPDFIIMDIDMPKMGGLEATRTIKHQYSSIKVIIISSKKNDKELLQLIMHGAKGFIEKGCASQIYWSAIESILNGDNYFSKSIIDRFNAIENPKYKTINEASIDILPEVFKDTRKTPFDFNFSDIDLKIAKLLFEKKSNIEISNIIFRDVSTVEYHIRLMKAKTACKSRHEIRDYIIKMCWHEDGTFQNLK